MKFNDKENIGHMVPSSHYLKANLILKKVNELAINSNLIIKEDDWPFHTLIKLKNNNIYSVYCNGFNSFLDVQKLLDNGASDLQFEECRFIKPKEVIDYLLRIL
jgi:hypothetical protein